jgi:enoyl-CoA hydratase/carnithine racemase
MKRCVLIGRDGGMRAGLATEAREVRDLRASDDGVEGVAAFVEKRPPRFGS